MPYDFDRYVHELVHLLSLSRRPGWSPERAARLYLEAAYEQGKHDGISESLQRVHEELQRVKTEVSP